VDLDELRVFADQAVGPVRSEPGVAHAAVEDLLERVLPQVAQGEVDVRAGGDLGGGGDRDDALHRDAALERAVGWRHVSEYRVALLELAHHVGVFLVDDELGVVSARAGGFGVGHVEPDALRLGELAHLAELVALAAAAHQHGREDQVEAGLQ
jgi:hypothetical protein